MHFNLISRESPKFAIDYVNIVDERLEVHLHALGRLQDYYDDEDVERGSVNFGNVSVAFVAGK